MMADVITLVFSLLEGELSLRFILKFLTVFVLAGLTFVYYFLSLKIAPGTKQEKDFNRGFLIGISLIAGITLAWGIMLSGSPATQRQHRFDAKRVENLTGIHQEIMNIVYDGEPYRTDILPRKTVPATLEEVQAAAVYTRPEISDPETGAPYEYRVVSKTAYELCATFNFERNEAYDVRWNHSAVRHCYTIDVRDAKMR